MDELKEAFAATWAPPYSGEIWDWTAEHVTLPGVLAVSGTFDVSSVPFVKEPMRALRDPFTREVSAMSGLQCLKTLIGEFWLLWTIAENGGPTQWLQPTDEDAKEHAKERFKPLIENTPVVHQFFTESRADKTTAFINFKHMYLRMEGQKQIANLQRKSIKSQMRSECWLWDAGHMDEARGRLTQFAHNSKGYSEGQGGVDGDDWSVWWNSGTQEVLHTRCQGCRKLMPLKWSILRDDGTRAGMRWDENERTRRPDGTWIQSEVEKSLRYECPSCGHWHRDDPRTRRLMMNEHEYVQQNDGADRTHRSFRWNQLIVSNISWMDKTRQWFKAREQLKKGDDTLQVQFFQKVLAEPDDPFSRVQSLQTTAYEIQGGWDDAKFVFMTSDVQAEEFYFVIRAWAENGDSRLYEEGKVFTDDELREKADSYKVPLHHVRLDAGWNSTKVYQICAKHREWNKAKSKWISWGALKGDDREKFKVKIGKNRYEERPFAWPPTQVNPFRGTEKERLGVSVPLVMWSNKRIKDILFHLKDGKGAKWEAHKDTSEEWQRHMSSEKLVWSEKSKKYRYEQIGKRANHLLDCEAMQVLLAVQAGVLNTAEAFGLT